MPLLPSPTNGTRVRRYTWSQAVTPAGESNDLNQFAKAAAPQLDFCLRQLHSLLAAHAVLSGPVGSELQQVSK